jgi:hypothetical protein
MARFKDYSYTTDIEIKGHFVLCYCYKTDIRLFVLICCYKTDIRLFVLICCYKTDIHTVTFITNILSATYLYLQEISSVDLDFLI